jgi:hypothetical protein
MILLIVAKPVQAPLTRRRPRPRLVCGASTRGDPTVLRELVLENPLVCQQVFPAKRLRRLRLLAAAVFGFITRSQLDWLLRRRPPTLTVLHGTIAEGQA